ncbi:MAG: creatininase family protein [Aquisalimonadaceae bacterium]
MTGQPCYWKDLTTIELADYAARDAVALLPLAAIEQHGPHLPLSTDLDIGNGLIKQAVEYLAEDFPLLVLPPLMIGDSMEHTAFSGTLSLEPETVITVIQQTGAAAARAGIRRLVLFNSHGGNRQVADIAALRLRRDHDLLVVKANYFRFPPVDVGLGSGELRHGIHGGALETALMLHFRHDAVRMERALAGISLGQALERDNSHLGPEGVASFAWMAQDLNVSGVVGDATQATAAMGEKLAAHYAGILAEVLEETLAFDLSALRP